MDDFKLDTPWHKLESGEGLENQLYKEIGKLHLLFGKKVKSLARRQDCDDVLFFLEDSSQFAIVHLTWAQKKLDDKHFPSTEFFNTAEDVQKRIDNDIKEWIVLENTPVDETGGFIKGMKKIIIVGASSGIGRELAQQYALKGNLVALTGRRTELLEELQKSFIGRIIYSAFDVTKGNNKEHLEDLVKRLGGLDMLIYCSGIGKPAKELDWELDKMTVDTNVNGFVEIANWGFNFFAKQGHGNMAVISSVAANRGNSWAPAYSASKAFQSNYFEALSIKAQRMKKNVFMTCVEPGFVDTNMVRGNKTFMLVPMEKAGRQIINAIEKKKRKVYVSKRWWLIVKLMRLAPFWIYKKIG